MWPRIYLYGLLQSLFFDQFLWLIYLLHLSYSLAQIGAGYATYQAARLIFDVPSSWWGDRFGKRAVFYAAAVAKTLSSLAFLFGGRGFGWIIAGFIAAGLGSALPSGVDLAYLQTLADKTGDESAQRVRLSRYIAMQTAASPVAGLVGGVLAARSFHTLYAADLMVGLVTMVCVWSLPGEPKPPRTGRREQGTGFGWRSYVDAVRLLGRSSSAFRRMAGISIVVWSLAVAQTNYSQGLLQGDGLNPTVISAIFTVTSLLAVFGAWFAGRFKSRRSEQAGMVLLTWLYAASGALRAGRLPPAAAVVVNAAGICAGCLASGFSGVLFNQRLLRHAPAQRQATALSAVNTVQMLLMMVVFPGLGLLATHSNLQAVFLACAGLLTATALFVTAGLRYDALD